MVCSVLKLKQEGMKLPLYMGHIDREILLLSSYPRISNKLLHSDRLKEELGQCPINARTTPLCRREIWVQFGNGPSRPGAVEASFDYR